MDIFLHSASFTILVQWVLAHGYWIIFLAMLVQGPIVTSAAGFGAALGYISPLAIFGLAMAADLTADVIYYSIGYWGRIALVERFGHFFGLNKVRIRRIESLVRDHSVRTILALKLTPVLPTPGLMIVGATKMDFKKFITTSLLISLPKTIIFLSVGYFFGQEYDRFSGYVSNASYLVLPAIAFIIIFHQLWNKLAARLAHKIVKI